MTSEEFKLSVITSTSCNVLKCDFCGITHFVSKEHFFVNDGENSDAYEQLAKQLEENKDQFKMHETSFLNYGVLDGRIYVAECECNSIERYEFFILNNRDVIKRYFENLKQKAIGMAVEFNSLVDALKSDADGEKK